MGGEKERREREEGVGEEGGSKWGKKGRKVHPHTPESSADAHGICSLSQ